MNETENPGQENKTAYRVPALEKGLDVLELMAEMPHALSLTDIAKKLNRTKQELFRIVAALQSRGYLLRDEAQRYRASTKMFELGSRNYSTQALVARSLPHMERLVDKLGESCHMNIVVQDRMLVVARAECPADVSLAVRVGAGFELHKRISGQVALAFMNQERRARYWEQTGEPTDVVQQIEAELAEIRRNGFDLADSPVMMGVKDCSVPILKADGSVLGVLCVSYLTRVDEQVDRSALPEAMQATARAIVAEFSPETRTDNTNTNNDTSSDNSINNDVESSSNEEPPETELAVSNGRHQF